MQAIFTNHFDIALIWMGVAVLIDATDGTLARRWNVKKYAAGTDGRRLDDIIDFISFAFLPMVRPLDCNVFLVLCLSLISRFSFYI